LARGGTTGQRSHDHFAAGKNRRASQGPDALAIADIDPRGQREGGDALNQQRDMRARLFRERNPESFRILTDPNPPVLAKCRLNSPRKRPGRIMARALTVGEEEFKQANQLVQQGKLDDAIKAFARLRQEYPATWIDRRSQERLAKLKPGEPLEERRSGLTNRAQSVSLSGPGGEGEGRGEVGVSPQNIPVMWASRMIRTCSSQTTSNRAT